MVYIDSQVREAHNEVPGTSVNMEVLAKLSQVYRSLAAQRVFEQITGFCIDSKDGLLRLFNQVKEMEFDLNAALDNEGLSEYVLRTSPFNLD